MEKKDLKCRNEIWVPVEMEDAYHLVSSEEFPVTFLFLEDEDGHNLMVGFTSEEEAVTEDKDTPELLNMDLMELFKTVMDTYECSGLIINPFTDAIRFRKNEISVILSYEDPSPDMELYIKGLQAFREKDFVKAKELFEEAKNDGSVVGTGYLGYCYLEGLGVEKDREKALLNLQMASIFGDVRGTYLLSEFYRDGTLDTNDDFADALIMKAFEDASQMMDYESFPEAFLWAIKYCSRCFDPNSIINVLTDAISGFEARVEKGDPFAAESLEEAKKLMANYKNN
ncbi:MAG: SseB family protein [Clostridia bacterium]|nr:SseB family protein [Clostridia bacterium]